MMEGVLTLDLSEDLMRVRRKLAADALADAAEKLGKCNHSDQPKHCARCAVKVAVQKYREATR